MEETMAMVSMTGERLENAIRSLQRQAEMLQRSFQRVFPEATDVDLHLRDCQLQIRVSEWDYGDPLREDWLRQKVKRRYLLDVEKIGSEPWSQDESAATNAYFQERGELLVKKGVA